MPERNSHHGLFPRGYYENGEKNQQEARRSLIYRNFNVIGHVALHKAVEPPPLLTEVECSDMLEAFDILKPDRGVESFEVAQDFFAMEAIQSYGEQQDRMFTIANNLSRQLAFIRYDIEEKWQSKRGLT